MERGKVVSKRSISLKVASHLPVGKLLELPQFTECLWKSNLTLGCLSPVRVHVLLHGPDGGKRWSSWHSSVDGQTAPSPQKRIGPLCSLVSLKKRDPEIKKWTNGPWMKKKTNNGIWCVRGRNWKVTGFGSLPSHGPVWEVLGEHLNFSVVSLPLKNSVCVSWILVWLVQKRHPPRVINSDRMGFPTLSHSLLTYRPPPKPRCLYFHQGLNLSVSTRFRVWAKTSP